MAPITCASFVLFNGTGVPQVQSFIDCSGNTCSVTIQPGEVYIITANLTSFVPNPDIKVGTYDTRFLFSFSSCCSNEVFHILGSKSESFLMQPINVGMQYCIDEFTNPLDCTTSTTPSIGCYTLTKIEQNIPSSTPLGNQMYIQIKSEPFKDCNECQKKCIGIPCCNCYQINLPSKCNFWYVDCETGKEILIELQSGNNFLCSAGDPYPNEECLYTLTNLGNCSENKQCAPCTENYCITNTGNEYDDTYTLDGEYDGYSYWISDSGTYYIYYNTSDLQWCLSTSLGGFCILSGKSPCFSKCPDLCEEYFFTGSCPTTTTTTIACSTFDFEAIFDCLAEPTPTPSVTPTITPTNTPTPTPTNYCPSVGVDAGINTYSPTPTPTPTITPTASPIINRPCNVQGDVSFTTIEGNISCPSSKQFQDCINGMMYYTTESVPTPSGDTLEQYMIFKAYVDGILKCVSYVGTTNDVIGVNTIDLVDGPVGYSNLGQCVLCEVIPTPTPTPTLTMTPTPSGIPCYCYELISGEKCVYSYTDCNGLSKTGVTSNSVPLHVCSLTTPVGDSLYPYLITKLDICVTGECPPLTCKCYRVSNGGPKKGTSSGITVVYYDCNNTQQFLHVNDYSSSQPFCSLTTPFIPTTGHSVTLTLVGDCVDGNCLL